MSILGQAHDLDSSVWQRRAVVVLGEILNAGYRYGLPALMWSVGPTGVLTGTALSTDMQARRAAFIAWAGFLGIGDWRAWDSNGVSHLTGVAGQAFHGASVARCKVMLSATVSSHAVEGGA